MRGAHDTLGHAADQCSRKAAPAVGAHHDQLGLQLLGHMSDHFPRVSTFDQHGSQGGSRTQLRREHPELRLRLLYKLLDVLLGDGEGQADRFHRDDVGMEQMDGGPGFRGQSTRRAGRVLGRLAEIDGDQDVPGGVFQGGHARLLTVENGFNGSSILLIHRYA